MPAKTAQVRKVLLIAPEMEVRGISQCAFGLARELRRQQVETAVFCAPGPMLERFAEMGIPVRTFDHLENMCLHLGEQKRFAQAAAEWEPQIVHGHSYRVAGAMKLLRGDCSAPQALTLHWMPPAGRGLRKFARGLAGIIATTQSLREELVNDCGLAKRQIEVIPNGIDVERLMERTIPPIFRSPVPAVGSLGPIEERRGHELFIQAAAELVRRGVKAQFVVAGQGEETPEIRRLIHSLDLAHRVTVAVDFAAYHDVLNALDIVVQSSQMDISGMSILEAMGHARPVIAFNTGTACELVEDGRTGVLVPKGDGGVLADAVQRLLADQDRARRMAMQAQQRVRERFDIRDTARQHLRLYAELLSADTPAS